MNLQVAGRAAELAAIESFLDSLAAGSAGLVLEGEPGIGKTTLCRRVIESASRRGFRVLACQPAAAEAELSYASLADLVAGVEPAVLRSLPRPQRHALDVVALRTVAAAVDVDRRATAAAFLSVVERLAEATPVILVVDDWQWVDASSRQAIAFAVRRLTGHAGVIVAVRSDDPAAPMAVPTLSDASRVRRMTVGPLNAASLRRVVADRLGRSLSRPALERVHRLARGNPLYALELVRGGREGAVATSSTTLPATLAELVDARIGAIGSAARPALLAAACLASPTVDLVQSAIGGDDAERLLAAAEEANLLRIEGPRVVFAHPLIATGVYSAAAAADRRAIHARLAEVVTDPEERARHLARAAVRADPRTIAALDEAAALARGRGATAAAAELLDLALDLGADDPERRIQAAWHHFDAGDPITSRVMLEDLVTALPPGHRRASALRALATVRLHDDSYLEAAAYLEQALDEAGDAMAVRARTLIDLLYVLVNLARIPEALALAGDAVASAEQLGDSNVTAQAVASAVMVGFLSGRGYDPAVLRRALDLENPDVPTPMMLRPSLIHGLLLGYTDRLDEAREVMLDLRARCLERGEESDLMFHAFQLVMIECHRGNFAGARLLAEDTMERATQLGTNLPLAIASSIQAQVDAYAGNVDSARDAAQRALEIFQRGSCLTPTVWPMATLGFLDVSLERYDEAASALGPLAANVAAMELGEPATMPFAADAAEALIATGRHAEAEALIAAVERDGRRLGRASALAVAVRCRALLLAAQGELASAAALARQAIAEHDRAPMPFERARTLLALGRIERRRRQKRAAAEALREALRTFEELDVPLWAAQARAALERVNVRPTDGAGLTPSERRVAMLAAEGMTNREVGAVLFISPKTVEANLSRVYRKLAIRSRAELARRAAELDG